MNFFQLMLELQHIMEVVQALKRNPQIRSRQGTAYKIYACGIMTESKIAM